MAISSMDTLVAALVAGQQKRMFKPSMNTGAVGNWVSLWAIGGDPAAGSAPGTTAGLVPTSATTGALIIADAVGPASNYLARVQANSASQPFIFVLADRLYHSSGLVGNVNTLQSVSSPPALTRPDSNGDNNELWIEWYTATGSTQVNMTVTYLDQNGNSQTTTFPFKASPVAGNMLQVPLAAGSTGVRSIVSCQLSATTGTAGNFGFTILRRYAEVMCPFGPAGDNLDAFALGLPVIYPGACLSAFLCAGNTTTGEVRASLTIAQG
jgi:hypothetical protein